VLPEPTGGPAIPPTTVVVPLDVPGGALAGVAEAAQEVEAAGLDGVTSAELTSDPMLHLTVAAGATSRIDLGTNLLVAFARSPMTLAVQARAVQDYSQGRLVLGLGSQIRPHIERRFSMPWSSPAARMAEFVSAMRAIWSAWASGERLDFRGDFYRHTLMTPMFTPPTLFPDPKVLVAGVGPKMTETAGAVADGLLVHPFTTERYLRERSVPALARGAARRTDGIGSSTLEVVDSTFLVTGSTEEELAASDRAVRQQLAFYGSTPAYRPVLELHGWGDVGDELNRLSRTRAADRWTAMGELVDDAMLQTFAVVAEPQEVAARLAERGAGVVTRYAVNGIGVPTRELLLEIAADLRSVVRRDLSPG
jgi:probable F420-dependent oxidoreductase